jgi:FixJ family two-component response regulator
VSTALLISIVDDDVSVRESLCCLFQSIRLGVEAFASAEKFLSSDRIRDTKCLILDVAMPGMSGLELQSRLIASHPQMPVIFISAHNDDELRAKALEGGAIDYLLKPLSDEALLNAVRTALSAG